MKFLYMFGQRDILIERAFDKYKSLFNSDVLTPTKSLDMGYYKCFGKKQHTKIIGNRLIIGHFGADWYTSFVNLDNRLVIENDANNLFPYKQ